MTIDPPLGVTVARQILDGLADEVYGWLPSLLDQVRQDLTGPAPRAADLRLESLVLTRLERLGAVVGAGFVAAPGVLTDRRYWLEWWTMPRGAGPARLVVQTDPDAADFRDYTTLPWFAGPAAGLGLSMVGPYVDYLCTDEYMLTFTTPVHAGPDREFLGVAGADVRVDWVARQLASAWNQDDHELVVVNRANRVVAAHHTDWLPGDLVRTREGWRAFGCQRLPLDILAPV